MTVTIGVDLGGSSTKLAALAPDGRLLGTLRAEVCRSADALEAALLRLLTQLSLPRGAAERIVLTGVGAPDITAPLLGLAPLRVDEFSAIAAGALALSGRGNAVVASLGTGTAFLYAARGEAPRHLCGSGVGGGTLTGLGRLLLGTADASEIDALSRGGDLARVDLTIGAMSRGPVGTLPPETTAANFAALAPDASREDIARGLVNLVLQSIGTMCVLCCAQCGTDTVVLTGTMTELSAAPGVCDFFSSLYGLAFLIPPHAAYATALGAALCAAHPEQEVFPCPLP